MFRLVLLLSALCAYKSTAFECNQPGSCTNQRCNNRANCVNLAPYGCYCNCTSAHFGTYCENSYPTCDRGCSGNGQCQVNRFALTATCVCDEDYEGAACERPKMLGSPGPHWFAESVSASLQPQAKLFFANLIEVLKAKFSSVYEYGRSAFGNGNFLELIRKLFS